jgi:hypothetical protein
MRTLLGTLSVIGLTLGVLGSASAGEQPDCKKLIEKAIKAQGGEAGLTKFKAITLKGSGKFYGLGEGVPFTGEWTFQPPKQSHVNIEITVNDMKFTMTRVVNGDKGWIRFMNKTEAMSKEVLAEEKERLYVNSISTLAPLLDKAFKLEPVGEVKVGDRPAWGVRVSSKGHRDVNFYFDKKDGLLLKTEFTVKDIENNSDTEINTEVFYSNYKDMDGAKRALSVTIKRDGKDFVEATFSEINPQEKVDDSVFAEP